ncbi:hypothetical protein SAMN05192539_10503 [Paraburkholderia diazotrophica]|uniref:Uncharacterized protein n=1 Tax=Paraburkholderia diazotrophica TaxID=667676 RepID=A0A1H7EAQ2_9BURK|nr:hypothetical protein SAMN05192539_10503 [Paraburkholderia diazotrophica]
MPAIFVADPDGWPESPSACSSAMTSQSGDDTMVKHSLCL